MENDVSFRSTIEDLTIFRNIKTPKFKASTSKNPVAVAAAEKRENERLKVAQGFLVQLGLTSEQFLESCDKILKSMNMASASKRGLRTSAELASRLVSMSGLIWNHGNSHSKTRDWGNIATIFALEAAYLPQYRPKLLRECAGARTVRRELHTLLVSISKSSQGMQGSAGNNWEFADGFALPSDDAGPADTSLGALLGRWKAAKRQYSRDDGHPSLQLIRSLEKHPNLQSSVAGSVETLASYHISALAEVCPRFTFPIFVIHSVLPLVSV